MESNYFALLLASAVPLLIGFLWYHPKITGKAWKIEAEMTEEKIKNFKMRKVFVLTFILSFLIAFFLQMITIHQYGVLSLIGGNTESAKESFFIFMKDYGTNYRSFVHGFFHGTIVAVLFVFPIIAINGMFERKSWKYIFINSGYWVVNLAMMGGIVCGWSEINQFTFLTPH